MGAGNASRANLFDPGAVHTAPGIVWLGERFDLGVGGGVGSDGSSLVHASAFDGQTSNIGLGVHWARRRQEVTPLDAELPGWRRKGESFNNEVESSVVSATIGGGGVHHLFGFGVGLRYYFRTSTLRGAEGVFNIAPSIAGIVAETWTLSLTVENPIPVDYGDAPLAVGSGTRWQPSDRFALSVDTLTDLGTYPGEVRFTPMAGAEIYIQDMVPVRVGWTQDGVSQVQHVTAGVGAVNESMGFNYAVLLDPWSSDDVAHEHRVSLRISM